MTCHGNEDWINRFLDGELAPEEGARFEEHLAGCAACRRELDQMRGLFAVLGSLEAQPAPGGMAEAVLARAPRPSAPPWFRWVLAAQAAATGMLLVLAYGRLVDWYEQLKTWLVPGWLANQVGWLTNQANWLAAQIDSLAGELAALWTRLAGMPGELAAPAWLPGLALTWPQAALMVLALAGLWLAGNRLLLAPKQNGTGGIR